VARGDQLHSERFLYSYDADLTAVIDARTTAAGIAAVKHLQVIIVVSHNSLVKIKIKINVYIGVPYVYITFYWSAQLS
jgi:hypothetical protein